MSRHSLLVGIAVCGILAGVAGCQPQQPFYLGEDGDLSHYLGVATEIEYPDVEVESLAEAGDAIRPFSLENSEPGEMWDLTLEEAVQLTLANSKVMRTLGGRTVPETLLSSPQSISTVYDPAITETDPRGGVEAALSAFDTQFSTSVFWAKNDTPRNTPAIVIAGSDIFPQVLQQDTGTFQAQLLKTAATGGTFAVRHNVAYDWSVGARLYPSDWNVNVEAEFRQPLLQGAGAVFNRIAGPGASPGINNGVMIARINTDIELAGFEANVRNLVSDVENAYWDLYFAYRALDAMKAARDRALKTWQDVHEEYTLTAAAQDEAVARQQYFEFRGIVEARLNALYAAESNLRYLMGLAATDGRLIRPKDEPETARVAFDWCEILCEGLARSAELRQEKWRVKQQELALVAAKNYLLPKLDAVGQYRWLGLGDDLLQSSGGSGNPAEIGSNAYQAMTGGEYQEWQLGLELSIPLGFRREMAGVRNAQLSLARERARLQEQELELSHQLAAAIRDLEAQHVLGQTAFNRRIAAQRELDAYRAREEVGYKVRDYSLDRLLDAQRRLASAEIDYYQSMVNYNKAITGVHFRKGSLLEYNGVYLSEGPWPGKAYFDARGRARARDAGLYMDYGYTQPRVVSRGLYRQNTAEGPMVFDPQEDLPAFDGMPEIVPTPAPEPIARPVGRPEPTPAGVGVSPRGSEPAAPGPAFSADGTGTSVLESLTLGRPTGGEAVQTAETAGQWSAVRLTIATEPVKDSQTDDGRRTASQPTPKSAPLRWSNLKGAGTRNETLANPPVVEADRAASGWKGVQR